MDRRKVVFVNPHPPERHGEESISVIVQMPLNLAYLAALTPQEEWDRDLVDETIELALDEHGEPIFDADLSPSRRSPTRARAPTRSRRPAAGVA